MIIELSSLVLPVSSCLRRGMPVAQVVDRGGRTKYRYVYKMDGYVCSSPDWHIPFSTPLLNLKPPNIFQPWS